MYIEDDGYFLSLGISRMKEERGWWLLCMKKEKQF